VYSVHFLCVKDVHWTQEEKVENTEICSRWRIYSMLLENSSLNYLIEASVTRSVRHRSVCFGSMSTQRIDRKDLPKVSYFYPKCWGRTPFYAVSVNGLHRDRVRVRVSGRDGVSGRVWVSVRVRVRASQNTAVIKDNSWSSLPILTTENSGVPRR